MTQFANLAQTVIYTTLSGGLSCPVYDYVPDQTPGLPESGLPYCVIGQDQVFPFDTDSWTGENFTIEVVFWSAYKGRKEVKTLMGEAYALLHRQPLSISGAVVNDCLHTFSSFYSLGGATYVQGLSRYRLIMTEVI